MTDSTLASFPTESTHQAGTWLKAKKLGHFQKCLMEERIMEEKENLVSLDKLTAQARVGSQQKKESCSGNHPGFPLGLFSKTHSAPSQREASSHRESFVGFDSPQPLELNGLRSRVTFLLQYSGKVKSLCGQKTLPTHSNSLFICVIQNLKKKKRKLLV